MASVHRFCTLHRIGYNSDLDPTCPQCMMGHIGNAEQLDYDIIEQKPVDAQGNRLDRRTLQPVK